MPDRTEVESVGTRSADRTRAARRLYAIAAVSIVLFFLTGFVGPQALLQAVDYDTELAGRELIEFIGQHRVWWFALQNLTMGSMVFLIVPLIALWPALRHGDAAVAAVGIVLAVSCQVLFMAYFPVVNGLLWIADRYAEATDPDLRVALIGGAEALVAMNNAYGTSDGIFAASVGIIAHAMRRSVFSGWVIAVGYATGVVGVLAAFLKPALGIHYLWWWVLLIVWLVGVGLAFWRMAKPEKA
ncbi:MAG: hypothetical protein RIE24_21485 [Silicimonas sp.]|jgi:hypothetical protein|uniref:hypothetical protein n=1 Tax=Roseitalea porphyridii TaxID=1852022 RepID=UPI0032EB38C7